MCVSNKKTIVLLRILKEQWSFHLGFCYSFVSFVRKNTNGASQVMPTGPKRSPQAPRFFEGRKSEGKNGLHGREMGSMWIFWILFGFFYVFLWVLLLSMDF